MSKLKPERPGEAKLDRASEPRAVRMSEPKAVRMSEGKLDRTDEPRAVSTREPKAVRISEPKLERPHADSRAAQLLTSALRTLAAEKKVSLREVGRRLRYRQPVVLSHMATGRVPIPIDRALDIARAVELPERTFLLACLQQRHPGIDWNFVSGQQDDFAKELAVVARKPLGDLLPEYKWVLREVVRDPQPSSRWLKTAELPTVELIRQLRPNFIGEGLSEADKQSIREALEK